MVESTTHGMGIGQMIAAGFSFLIIGAVLWNLRGYNGRTGARMDEQMDIWLGGDDTN